MSYLDGPDQIWPVEASTTGEGVEMCKAEQNSEGEMGRVEAWGRYERYREYECRLGFQEAREVVGLGSTCRRRLFVRGW